MKPDKVENIDEQQQQIEKEKAELERQQRQRETEEKREREGGEAAQEREEKQREKKKNRQSQVQAPAQQSTFAPYSLTLASGYFMCISGKTAKTAITTPASDLRSSVLLKAASLGDAYSGNTMV